ncbi:hypothetical protein FB451DRAFT_1184012 [Mycena latifolia]|nr:hypothetical protein FB451DRAFT_1184012 [Mycena latifolia]
MLMDQYASPPLSRKRTAIWLHLEVFCKHRDRLALLRGTKHPFRNTAVVNVHCKPFPTLCPSHHWRHSDRTRHIFAQWFTTTEPLPWRFSCDWASTDLADFFMPLACSGHILDTRTQAESVLNDAFGVRGTIQPLAYHINASPYYFLFEADGVYYDYSTPDDTVYRYDKERYDDPVHFIWRVDEGAPATVLHPQHEPPRLFVMDEETFSSYPAI